MALARMGCDAQHGTAQHSTRPAREAKSQPEGQPQAMHRHEDRTPMLSNWSAQ